ncbi:MAG: hypothetical protein GWO30_04395, partial [Gammaproteobacteria bacterium]|nr:hypothetical protein [Gammaproteobacteria bacterium]NIR49079.1 hypothetical protein [candidate division KSB1 bacterium]NIS24583.1 hypothetical protein [candidate division KSB1 bacterium]NIV69740.1 hypothetical protein [Phycisphaerae bacterium]NIY19697.1 hypothetical protein [Gammaproteobacteria bacterium]
RVRVADNKNSFLPDAEQILRDFENRVIEIDSYHVDQAIKSKVEERNKGLANDGFEIKGVPDLSQQDQNFDADIERGYTLWRKSVDPDYSPKITQVI